MRATLPRAVPRADARAGEVGVATIAPLVRDRFHEGGDSRATAFQQGPVAGVAFAGLGAQFY